MKNVILLLLISLLFGCNTSPKQGGSKKDTDLVSTGTEARYSDFAKATFAGGCFWCVEAVFERVEGVEAVISGYAGGEIKNPTYEQVASGQTKHAEAVVIYYNPEKVTYETLLEVFFATHDPTQLNRQGPDVGAQYRSAVFYHDEEQKQKAKAYMEKLGKSGKFDKPIVTELTQAGPFYVAEEYHQDYYPSHPLNPYIQRYARPKVEKLKKEFPELLKASYRS